MWYEALPSMIAMGAAMSLIELGPFITHYASWGCPMQRHGAGGLPDLYLRRDQRIAEENGIRYFAKHMYTYGLSALDGDVKKEGNCDHYKKAEEAFQRTWEGKE